MLKPRQLPCSHFSCLDCFSPNQCCPTCKEQTHQSDLKIHKEMQSKTLSSFVGCHNTGCSQTFKLTTQDFLKHRSTCLFEPVECDECHCKVPRGQLSAHSLTHLLGAPVSSESTSIDMNMSESSSGDEVEVGPSVSDEDGSDDVSFLESKSPNLSSGAVYDMFPDFQKPNFEEVKKSTLTKFPAVSSRLAEQKREQKREQKSSQKLVNPFCVISPASPEKEPVRSRPKDRQNKKTSKVQSPTPRSLSRPKKGKPKKKLGILETRTKNEKTVAKKRVAPLRDCRFKQLKTVFNGVWSGALLGFACETVTVQVPWNFGLRMKFCTILMFFAMSLVIYNNQTEPIRNSVLFVGAATSHYVNLGPLLSVCALLFLCPVISTDGVMSIVAKSQKPSKSKVREKLLTEKKVAEESKRFAEKSCWQMLSVLIAGGGILVCLLSALAICLNLYNVDGIDRTRAKTGLDMGEIVEIYVYIVLLLFAFVCSVMNFMAESTTSKKKKSRTKNNSLRRRGRTKA